MRVTDFFYATAFAVLMGWLFLGSVIDAEHLRGSLSDESAASSSPAVSASPQQPQPDEITASSLLADSASAVSAASLQPNPLALATVDERSFWIFVGGSSDIWSVAVGESPDLFGSAVGEITDVYGVAVGESPDLFGVVVDESTDVYGVSVGEAD
jgi:hypothetical protein